MAYEKGAQLLKQYEFLCNERSNFDTRWDFMAPFLAPSRVGILSGRAPGQDQMAGVNDSTSMGAADLFAKFIVGQTMNPGQRWGKVSQKKFGIEDRDEVDDWADETTDRMLQALGGSNFYAEAPEMALDYGAFGTGCLYGSEREEHGSDYERKRGGFRGLNFQCMKTGRFAIAENAQGKADKIFRECTMSARAIRDRFGEANLPEKVSQVLKSEDSGKQEEMFTLVHAVYPRPHSERNERGNRGYAYASCWIEKESKQVISEGGFKWFPFAIPRCEKTPGEVYGRGPGDRAFPDTQTLNKLKELELRDLEQKVLPSIIVAHEARVGDIRLRAGAPTVVRIGQNRSVRDVMAPWESGSRPEVAQLNEEQLRRSIERLFFVDLLRDLLKIEKSEMTAYEYAEKLRLLYQLLGSIYGRWESEFLAPIWDATFSLMWDAGAISPPPAVLFDEGKEVAIEFTSPLALAQKSADVDAIRMTFADIGLIALNDPAKAANLKDNFEDDETVRYLAEKRGMPARLIRNKKLRDEIRAARSEQQMQQAEMARVESITQAGKNLAPLITAMKPEGNS